MKYKEVEKKLRKMGCIEVVRRGSGSHRKWHNPRLNTKAIMPDWGSKDLKVGTLRRAVKDLGFEWEGFVEA